MRICNPPQNWTDTCVHGLPEMWMPVRRLGAGAQSPAHPSTTGKLTSYRQVAKAWDHSHSGKSLELSRWKDGSV